MTTPEQLTTALKDFIKECANNFTCAKCEYKWVCREFDFQDNAPEDWDASENRKKYNPSDYDWLFKSEDISNVDSRTS